MKVCEQVNVVQVPTEDKWFEVNPRDIDQSLFKKKRNDKKQEKTRKLIKQAFAKVKSNPEKYGKNFKTLMPRKTWSSETFLQLNLLTCKLGDHNADWVEQALEWAQRIYNGESWETVCNNPDTAHWFRLIVWKNGDIRCVGGSTAFYHFPAPSDVGLRSYSFYEPFSNAVPLVVLYKK